MFTGIVEETGEILKVVRGDESFALTIAAQTVLDGTKLGEVAWTHCGE